jgi:hypothetical protein
MLPEIERVIRQDARNYLLRDVFEVGLHTQCASDCAITFDDIYFMGVCKSSEEVALDILLLASGRDYPSSPISPVMWSRVFLETSGLVADLYHSTPDKMQERWHGIQERFASWVHARHESR